SLRSTWMCWRASIFLATRRSTSKPSDATFSVSSRGVSSKPTKSPGSPQMEAPRTRNSSPRSVFPHPGPPHTRAVRPAGRPPPAHHEAEAERSLGARGPLGRRRRLVARGRFAWKSGTAILDVEGDDTRARADPHRLDAAAVPARIVEQVGERARDEGRVGLEL